MKIGFLGPAGSFTEEAARLAHPGTHVPQPSIAAVFAAVAAGEVSLGVVPFENVIHGYVTEALDALYTHADAVKIIDSRLLPIEHALGALPQHGEITQILSKDQALQQCSEYLQAHHPQAVQIATPSTSEAMRRIVDAGRTDAAAIGHAAGLKLYGLTLLRNNIGNIKHNKTRFLTLAPIAAADAPHTGRDATAVVIYPHHDRVGLLQEILTIVSTTHGLSCSSIQSRPDTRGAFRFYLELEGHLLDAQVAACLADLRAKVAGATIEVKVCGSYPRRAFYTSRIKNVTIVGGTGRMGRWFEAFFSRAGCSVGVSDEHTPEASLLALLHSSDAVLINVPIAQTEAVIAQVARQLRPGQLLVDNTSIKTAAVDAMWAAAPPGVEVLGMHTVFGPNIGERLLNQNVVFVRTPSCGDMTMEFEGLFHKYGARLRHTTAAHHDRQMALHQNLEHFSKMVLAQLVAHLFSDPAELINYASPNSRSSLATMGRILSGDPGLYAEIQVHNLQAQQVLETYLHLAQDLLATIQRSDRAAVEDRLRKARQALGERFLQAILEL